MPQMTAVLTILLGVAMAAVLVVLMTGVVLFARGGETNRRWSLRLMHMRVAVQLIIIIIIVLLFLAHNL